MGSAARAKQANEMLERVGLDALADRTPDALSGGQKQRVALARALVIDPPLLMFDEPLSNLDAKLRVEMRVEIRRLQRDNGRTALYVTHDQEEAFSISDRVAIMNAGRILQLDVPEVLYSKPADAFVANFVGFENIIQLRSTGEADGFIHAEMAGGAVLTLPREQYSPPAQDFLFATRADGLMVSRSGEGIPARLGLRTYLGRAYQYRCETAAGEIIANGRLSEPLEPGTEAVLVPQHDQCTVLPVES